MRNLSFPRGWVAGPIWILTCFLSISFSFAAIDTAEDLERVYHEFYGRPLDLGTVYAADGFKLTKDAMTFEFKSGDIFLMEPVNGEVTGAYFIGKGRARMTPPVPMERKSLARYTGAETLDMEFTEMFLRFSDDTGAKLKALPTGETGDLPVPAEKFQDKFRDRMQHLARLLSQQMEMEFLETRISDLKGRNFLFAEFQPLEGSLVSFAYDDMQIREVFLGRVERIGAVWRIYTWAWFNKAADYNEQGHYIANLTRDSKEPIDVLHYDMKIDIQNLQALEIDARVRLASQVDGLRGIRMALLNNLDYLNWDSGGQPLDIQLLTDAEDNPLPYIHKRHQLVVLLPQPLAVGQEYTFRIRVRERTIQQLTKESFSLLNTYPWYPWAGYLGGRFTFEWEVRVPKPYTAAGSGVRIKEWEDGDQNCATWRSTVPVHVPSLLFGRFQRESAAYKSVTGDTIRLNVYSFPEITFARYGVIKVPVTKNQDILAEAQQIMKLFEDIYGPFPYRELDIAMMSPGMGFGQSPPGLVQLTGEAFMSAARVAEFFKEGDFIHGFLSHEMAHQWWFNEIGFYDDEDEWLSESFAEYAAGIYVQQLQGENRFQQKVKDWTQSARIADPVAPIAAANRVEGDNAFRDRTFLIYNKGPLVLHMLREQIGDENYKKGMTAVCEKYANMNIKTEHVARELEKVVGYRLDWFFDQWFRDTGIPEITFSYTIKPTEDGKYLFTGRIQQDPENFKLFLTFPVTFDFGKDQVATQKVLIKEPDQTFQVKLPAQPKKVEANGNNADLAEVSYAKNK